MFIPDVISLRQFYATPLGGRMRALLEKSIGELWPGAAGDAVLGIGYATPYLAPYAAGASLLAVCMPAAQGAAYWAPQENGAQANVVLMAHESELPFRENSINRILLVHCLENSEQLSWMMEELWRVLTPGGRVLAIVPNRLGAWSRSSRTPLGHGRPFSKAQLRDLLTSHQFSLTRASSALFIPPTKLSLLWRLAPKLEAVGKALRLFIGGVLLVEAEKQIYAPVKQPVMARKAYGIPIPAAQGIMSSKVK